MNSKQNVVYPYNELLFGHKKEWSFDTHLSMDLGFPGGPRVKKLPSMQEM